MITAGVGAYLGVGLLVIGGWLFLTVAIWRTNFFEAKSKRVQRAGNLLISLAVLAVLICVMAYVPRKEQPHPDERATLPPVVRVKYSSTQTIKVPGTESFFDMLNLDNVATMFPRRTTDDGVEMVLSEAPPLMIDQPTAGKGYKSADGGVIKINPDKHPTLHVEQAMVAEGGKPYLFNRSTSPAQVVQVGDRRFRIMLQSVIVDESTGKQRRIAYTFGISEQ